MMLKFGAALFGIPGYTDVPAATEEAEPSDQEQEEEQDPEEEPEGQGGARPS